MELTTADRLDICELPYRYADALDLLQPARLAAVFTPDAVWEMAGRDFRLVGLEAIQEFMGREDVHPGAHLMTNVYVESVEGDEASGVTVRLSSRGVFPVAKGDRHLDTEVFYGRYEDEVVPTAAGWRIRRRRFTFGGAGLGDPPVD